MNENRQLNIKSSNKSLINKEKLKKLMKDEKCLQVFSQQNSIKHYEKRPWKNSSLKNIGQKFKHKTLLMNFCKQNNKDFMKNKCKLKKSRSI